MVKRILRMNLCDIKIPEGYKSPNAYKLNECRQYYQTNGKLDRQIVVGEDNYIVDGYVGLLILQENGVEEFEVASTTTPSYRKRNTVYAFGRHGCRTKEYVWRITKNTKDVDNLKVGNRMLVNTKEGLKVVVITRISTLDKPPVDSRIKKVVKCYEN